MSWRIWTALVAVMALGGALRGARLSELPGGYLAFNEGFYVDAALRGASQTPLSWFAYPPLYDKPPLYAGIVTTLYQLGAPSIAGARLVSVAAGLCTILLTFLLGRMLFGQNTGLAAAAVLAVMPGAVLVDHNIQVDSLLVCLMMTAVYLYVRSVRTGIRDAVAGGIMLGLAILTKQPAVLVLAALAVWETWGRRDFAWMKSGRFWVFSGTTLAIGASWYVLQLVIASEKILSGMTATGGRSEMSQLPLSFWTWALPTELNWMLFPVAGAFALAGILFSAWRRRPGDKLILVFVATFLAYYALFHLHSYYLLPMTPFLALAIGRLTVDAFSTSHPARAARLGILLFLVAVMTLGSLVTLGSQKWGRWSPATLHNSTETKRPIVTGSGVTGFYGPTPAIIDRGWTTEVMSAKQYASLPATTALGDFVEIGPIYGAQGQMVQPVRAIMDRWYSPVAFGYAVHARAAAPSDSQVFRNTNFGVSQVGPLWQFGITSVEVESGVYIYNHGSFR